MTSLLHIDDLVVDYGSGERAVRALDGAALTVERGQTVGIVGESGSGKSTLGSAIGGLLPGAASVTGGSVLLDGEDVNTMRPRRLRELRRERLGYVFQEPIGSLDPTMRIGKQVELALRGRGTRADVAEHLERVKLADPKRVARSYPHQLSGGMAQRVAIAMAMAGEPELLIADEPTAALDSQIREEVLGVIFSLAEAAGTTILWLSHDLPAVAKRCSEVVVMYGGRVVESGAAHAVLTEPRHPYTSALVRAVPGGIARGQRLVPIAGQPPVLHGPARGCAFAPRCGDALPTCEDSRPPLVGVGERDVLCHLTERTVGAGR
ncbi:dipeptide/oligopeptide/nickel ABC transporter ATP-binding protein [Prauserella marina]|uniref:Peptide/nickel transport system ATP-binding protein/peptide/nickel transport system permease protein n=1 Tax=Prauserella marina TaxID=530584 RepID=A0A222VPE4_9PSEU|nr:ABC transporter ATP-binding protein [Prauserella marina]ASR35591.1 dipeptide/oligopeptide/nickel ABC transporter ATP-binding protein [Prauserella marina]PWV84554.1 peptide/nickel transport system ATP-binding protein [Prauserella marina]SDC19342.1 peptide/nickel transport system ATP-binding protein/peptide/nickel transport system permease protein [Prauserella marina]